MSASRLALAVASLALLACGCSSESPREEAAARHPSYDAPASAGPPSRVVALAPNLVDLVFELGAGDSLVGVSEYTNFPPEARDLPVIGALMNMNFEAIRALSPDLVLALPGQSDAVRKLSALGIDSLVVKSDDLADVRAGALLAGERLGRSDRAREVVAEFDARLEALRGSAEERRSRGAPRVLFVVGRNPGTLQGLYVCGSGNFLHEMLELVGASNAMGDTATPWPLVGKEAVLALDPDVILDSSSAAGDGTPDPAHEAAWKTLPALRAVRESRVRNYRDDRLMIPSPGVLEAAERLAILLDETTSGVTRRGARADPPVRSPRSRPS